MKKALWLFVLALGLAVVAFAGVDFSGTWAFDAANSDAARGGGGGGGGGARMGGAPSDLTIKQTGNEIAITQMRGGNPSETKYIADGAEHTNTTPMGDAKYKAELSGETLTITMTSSMGDRGSFTSSTKYALSADGKVLTVTTTSNFGGTERVRKQVYNKK